MIKLPHLLLMSTAMALGACGGNGGSSEPTPPPPPAAVAPTAAFTASAEAGTVPLAVTFTSTSTAGSSPITSVLWDFGDGTTSTDTSPSHTYTVAGDFDVKLTVTTSVGSDDEDKADFVDVDPALRAIEPTAIEMFEVDGTMVEAAKNQVLAFFTEDVTQAQVDAAYASVEALGGGVQSFDEDLRMAQIFAADGEELTVLGGLDGLDGVSSSSLNLTLDFNWTIQKDNQKGFNTWKRTVKNRERQSTYVPEKVEIDSSFDGGYWIDQINLEGALTELEDVTLDSNILGVVDSGLPAAQSVLEASRVNRFSPDGTGLDDDDTFGTGENLQTHGRDVIGLAAGLASMVRGVNATSNVVSFDVYRQPDGAGEEATPPKIFITGRNDAIRSAINEGASVVNVSIGATVRCTSSKADRTSKPQTFRDSVSGAVNYARRNNANVIFSSGNHCEKEDNQLLTDTNDRDADSWASNALIVGASDETRNDACFSVMGSVVDLTAPGEKVGYGDGREINGTSFAAPLVAGSMSLIRSINDTLSAPEARTIILNTVNRNLTAESVETHQADALCPSASTRNAFPDDAGVSAGPVGILNLGGAVNTALLAKDVDLTTLADLTLANGTSQTVPVAVTLPEAGVAALDLMFVIDRSGSYGDDINTLQNQAVDIIASLSETGIDIRYGVSSFADFPINPYGISTDEPFTLLQSITSDVDATLDAIDRLDQPLQNGNDSPESQYEALFQVATGPVGFREGALPVILFATDADFHDSDVDTDYPGAGRTETLAALTDQNITVFGLQSGGSSSAAARLNELAEVTEGAVFSLDRSSSDIADAISDAVDSALQEADITLETLAGADWISNVTPAVFEDVPAGDTVTFEVELTGIRNAGLTDDLKYEVYLWAKADEEALISRVFQPIIPE